MMVSRGVTETWLRPEPHAAARRALSRARQSFAESLRPFTNSHYLDRPRTVTLSLMTTTWRFLGSSADPSLLSCVVQREVLDMTLRQFKTITGSVTPSALRRVMAIALAVEPVDGPEAYERFYSHVIAELRLTDKRRAVAPRASVAA